MVTHVPPTVCHGYHNHSQLCGTRASPFSQVLSSDNAQQMLTSGAQMLHPARLGYCVGGQDLDRGCVALQGHQGQLLGDSQNMTDPIVFILVTYLPGTTLSLEVVP